MVPVIWPGGSGAGGEPVGEGLAGAVRGSQQAAGLAHRDLLEAIGNGEVAHRLIGFVGVEDVAEDQAGALHAPHDVEVGVDIGGAATGTGVAHPSADYDVRVVADEPGVVPGLGGPGLGCERPLDVQGGTHRPEDVTDHVGDLRGQHANAGARLPFLERLPLAVDNFEDDRGVVVDSA